MNRSRQLLLTLDYEIFGNGSGDVRRHMVEPTERMARICERYEVPLTIFFEAEEYLGFCRNARDLEQALGYDPARLIREQVRSLVRCGHDFQLHLHPQWYGARFASGHWILHPELQTVDHLFETEEETGEYIASRKTLLDELTDGAAGSRRVIAYRAGAFSARPGKKLLWALAENAIGFDSSVVRGLYYESGDYFLDYRHVNTGKRLWRVRDDVTKEDAAGPVWEIPIHSTPARRYQQLTLKRLRAKFSENVPKRQQRQMLGQFVRPAQPWATMKTFFEPVPIKLDFHNQGPKEFCRSIAVAESAPSLGPLDVVVAIGHSKEHADDRSFSCLIKSVSEQEDLTIATFHSISGQLSSCNREREPKEVTN